MQKRNKSRSQRQKTSAIHAGGDNDTTEGKTRIKPLAKVVQLKKKLNSPILIAGFPGVIVPGVIYAEGKLRHPFRLYSNERGNICVLVCEAPVMIQGIYSVLDAVSKWVLRNNVRGSGIGWYRSGRIT